MPELRYPIEDGAPVAADHLALLASPEAARTFAVGEVVARLSPMVGRWHGSGVGIWRLCSGAVAELKHQESMFLGWESAMFVFVAENPN